MLCIICLTNTVGNQVNKVAQIKPSPYDHRDNKKPIYYIICEGYSIESARMIREQLEDLWVEYWNDEFKSKPLTKRYSISVS